MTKDKWVRKDNNNTKGFQILDKHHINQIFKEIWRSSIVQLGLRINLY